MLSCYVTECWILLSLEWWNYSQHSPFRLIITGFIGEIYLKPVLFFCLIWSIGGPTMLLKILRRIHLPNFALQLIFCIRSRLYADNKSLIFGKTGRCISWNMLESTQLQCGMAVHGITDRYNQVLWWYRWKHSMIVTSFEHEMPTASTQYWSWWPSNLITLLDFSWP